MATYSGVRPLYDDHAANASKVTRDYVLKLDDDGGAPVLSVFGGKITTYRELAEDALQTLDKVFPEAGGEWTRDADLPGGDMPRADFDGFHEGLRQDYPKLSANLLQRLARAYGTDARRLLGQAETDGDLGRMFGASLTETEARYLVEVEFARTADDILWRRSKLGLHMSAAERDAFAGWMATEMAVKA